MIEPPAKSLESIDDQGRGLRVDFWRLDDRYAHRLFVIDAKGRKELVLESLESQSLEAVLLETESSEQASEASAAGVPAWQDLHFDQLPDQRRVAGLIGMSGDCRWSLAVEPIVADGHVLLRFDGACRVQRRLVSVACGYRLIGRGSAVARGETRSLISMPSGEIAVEALPIDSSPSGGVVVVSPERIRIIRPIDPSDRLPATLRWRYQFGVYS